MTVRVQFDYEPDEPDDDDKTGMSEAEYEKVTDGLMQTYGAENIEFEKKVT